MTTPILNREFQHPADGWYHIEPSGEHPNSAAGIVQVIDAEACEKIVNRFNADAKAGALQHGHEMLIDHEHFSHDADKETLAFGWLTRLQNRADGIYGRVRWTATGKAAVDGGDYRFFSTEYDPQNLEALNPTKTLVRPLAIAGLSLTNRPNNRGGKPITNSEKAQRDFTNRIVNRAAELKGAAPSRSFDDCWQQAQREALRRAPQRIICR
jgi:phage I-like protein